MVQILPNVRKPSFSQSLGQALGAGIGSGISSASQFAQQMGMEKIKQNMRRNFIEEIERGGVPVQPEQPSYDELSRTFLDSLPQIEERLGREITPQEADEVWKMLQGSQGAPMSSREEDPFRKARQYAALGEKDLETVALKQAEMQEKRMKEKRGQHFELGKEALKKAESISEGIPQKQMALENMKEAIQQGNLSFFSPDNLAELTGIEAFRTPKGAAFKTASKEFFMSNLGRVGAKGLNQWLERQIIDMSPKLGRSPQANLTVAEILQAELDVAQRQVELTNEIADRYESEHGFIPRNLSSLVQKELSKYATKRQMEAKKNIESIQEEYTPSNKEGILMYDPSGSLRRVPKKDISEAKENGYRVYK